MRRLALVALAACGGGGDGAPRIDAAPMRPAILDDASQPGADIAPCAAGVLPWRNSCRADGYADLDGDGVLDCWRVGSSANALWPGCAGAAVTFEIAVDRFTLPPAQRTRAWARAIAVALVGEANAGCEIPDAHCAAAPGFLYGLARLDDVRREDYDLVNRTVPLAWIGGEPSYPPPSAMVLADLSILRWTHDIDLEPHDHRIVRGKRCGRYQLWHGGGLDVIEDLDARQWTLVHGGTHATCLDGLVFYQHGFGLHSGGTTVVDPVAGVAATFAGGDITDLEVRGELLTWVGRLPLTQVRAVLTLPREPPTSCPYPGDEPPPLIGYEPPAPCESSGEDEVARGVRICWSAKYFGTPAGGLEWELWGGVCGRPEQRHRANLLLGKVVTVIDRSRAPHDGLFVAWLSDRLVGAPPSCVVPRKGCARSDPAVAWMHARLAGVNLVPPVWQDGEPRMPRPATVIPKGILTHEDPDLPALLVYTAALDGALTPQPGCDRWQVFAGPGGGAVGDPTTKRWAWAYLASPGDPVHQGDRAAPVLRGACDGDLAWFFLDDGDVALTDPAHGKWTIVPAAEWPTLRGQDALRAKLAE